MRPRLAVALLSLLTGGCSVTRVTHTTEAAGAPPFRGTAGQYAQDNPPSQASAGQASCGSSTSLTNFELFRNYTVGSSQQHTNPDGSVDLSSFNFGGATDQQGLATAAGLLGSVAGMALKGATTGGVGTMAVIPDRDGTLRLVPMRQAQEQPSPAQAWAPASAAGCVPQFNAPGFSAGAPSQQQTPATVATPQDTAPRTVVPPPQERPPYRPSSYRTLPRAPRGYRYVMVPIEDDGEEFEMRDYRVGALPLVTAAGSYGRRG